MYKNASKLLKYIMSIFIFILSLPSKVFAGSIKIGGEDINIEFPVFNQDLSTPEGVAAFVGNLLNFIVGFSAVVAVVMIIYGGFTFITAAGNPDNISKGGKILTAAIVGMIIVFIAKLIITFIVEEFLL